MPKKYNATKQKQYKSANYQKRRKELLRDQPLCHWCKQRPATEADHLIELDIAGNDGPLVPSCKPCNARRGANYKAKKNSRQKNHQTKTQREKKPKPFFDYLQTDKDEVMTFSDHHHFTESDILNIKSQAIDKIIVTTEKDFVRLNTEILRKQLYYLPIKSKLISKQDDFNQLVLSYVTSYVTS